MPRQIGGVGELLLISPPQLFRVRVGLDFIKGRRRVGQVSFCATFPGRCNERRTEIGGDDALAVELAQNVQIIEISHAGVGGGAGHDGFQLFGQNGFQIVRPNFDGAILQHQLKAVTHLVGRDGVAGGNVDLERRYHTVKLRFHADTDARICFQIRSCRSANGTIPPDRGKYSGTTVEEYLLLPVKPLAAS